MTSELSFIKGHEFELPPSNFHICSPLPLICTLANCLASPPLINAMEGDL